MPRSVAMILGLLCLFGGGLLIYAAFTSKNPLTLLNNAGNTLTGGGSGGGNGGGSGAGSSTGTSGGGGNFTRKTQ